MPTLEEKLSGYEDFELAFMYRYQLSSYMPETQRRVVAYLVQRGINEKRVDELIRDVSLNTHIEEDICPRCRTKKIEIRKVDLKYNKYPDPLVMRGNHVVEGSYAEEIVCMVCGFWISDPNKEQGIDRKKAFREWLRESRIVNRIRKIFYR